MHRQIVNLDNSKLFNSKALVRKHFETQHCVVQFITKIVLVHTVTVCYISGSNIYNHRRHRSERSFHIFKIEKLSLGPALHIASKLKILAPEKLQCNFKESVHFNCENTLFNQKVNHVNLKFTV